MSNDSRASLEGERAAHRRIWAIAACTMALICFYLVTLYHEAVIGAVGVWIVSPTYNHCFLILPISVYLAWERRHLLADLVPEPNFWFILVLPAIGAVWLFANTASILEGEQLALMAMLQLSFVAIVGWRTYRAFMFPALYLFFLVPTGEYLVPPLQTFTAEFSVAALRVVGIPVFVDGIFISIPTGHFEVAEACAGLRFLIATIAFGFLFANMVYRSMTRRVIFIALCIVVPIIANGFRAFGIIIVAYLSSNELAVGVDHIVYGWVFFSFVLLLLIWIGLQFREPEEVVEQPAADWTPPTAPNGAQAIIGAGIAVMLFAAAAPSYAAYLRLLEPTSNPALLAAPAVEEPWTLSSHQSDWNPTYPTADRIVRQRYASQSGDVDLYLAFFKRQTAESEVIATGNNVSDDVIWHVSGYGSAVVNIDGRPVSFVMARMISGDRRRVVLRAYWIGSTLTVSGLKAKLLQAYGELVSQDRAAAAILLSAEYSERPEEAVELIRDFLNHAESFDDVLGKAS